MAKIGESKKYIIAIDGPSGAGKTTLSQSLAKILDFPLLLTGKIYRAYAKKIITHNIDITNLSQMLEALSDLPLADLSGDDLNTEENAAIASKISSISEIRELANQYQFDFIKNHQFAILEGRDIGTVICPEANLKIYLVADPCTRAQRRLAESSNPSDSYEKILAKILARDERDFKREVAPLRPAHDAIVIDNSNLTQEQQIQMVVEMIPLEFKS